jgi:hypothetical protein
VGVGVKEGRRWARMEPGGAVAGLGWGRGPCTCAWAGGANWRHGPSSWQQAAAAPAAKPPGRHAPGGGVLNASRWSAGLTDECSVTSTWPPARKWRALVSREKSVLMWAAPGRNTSTAPGS